MVCGSLLSSWALGPTILALGTGGRFGCCCSSCILNMNASEATSHRKDQFPACCGQQEKGREDLGHGTVSLGDALLDLRLYHDAGA